MKVIGTGSEGYSKEYICTITHTELEKYLGLYYSQDDKKLKSLKVGDEVDLTKGFEYAGQISDALRQTREFVESHRKVVSAILNGLRIERLHDDQLQDRQTGSSHAE